MRGGEVWRETRPRGAIYWGICIVIITLRLSLEVRCILYSFKYAKTHIAAVLLSGAHLLESLPRDTVPFGSTLNFFVFTAPGRVYLFPMDYMHPPAKLMG